MNCPKCGKKMRAGFLQAGKLVAFNRYRHIISLLSRSLEDVIIAQKYFVSSNFHGFVCKTRGLIVFDYTENNAKQEHISVFLFP